MNSPHQSYPRWNIRGVLFYSVIGVNILILSLPLILTARLIGSPKFIFWVVGIYFKILLSLFRVKMKVFSRENMDPDKAYLVLSNHQSYLDIPLILGKIRILSFLAKIEIKQWPFFGPAMTLMNCIFVDRKDPRSRAEITPQLEKNIKRGISYCVFPEGTRSEDGIMRPFKRGIFKIAMAAKVQILPITICNSWEILPKKTMYIRSGTIRSVIHRPVDPSEFESPEELTRVVEERVRSELTHEEN